MGNINPNKPPVVGDRDKPSKPDTPINPNKPPIIGEHDTPSNPDSSINPNKPPVYSSGGSGRGSPEQQINANINKPTKQPPQAISPNRVDRFGDLENVRERMGLGLTQQEQERAKRLLASKTAQFASQPDRQKLYDIASTRDRSIQPATEYQSYQRPDRIIIPPSDDPTPSEQTPDEPKAVYVKGIGLMVSKKDIEAGKQARLQAEMTARTNIIGTNTPISREPTITKPIEEFGEKVASGIDTQANKLLPDVLHNVVGDYIIRPVAIVPSALEATARTAITTPQDIPRLAAHGAITIGESMSKEAQTNPIRFGVGMTAGSIVYGTVGKKASNIASEVKSVASPSNWKIQYKETPTAVPGLGVATKPTSARLVYESSQKPFKNPLIGNPEAVYSKHQQIQINKLKIARKQMVETPRAKYSASGRSGMKAQSITLQKLTKKNIPSPTQEVRSQPLQKVVSLALPGYVTQRVTLQNVQLVDTQKPVSPQQLKDAQTQSQQPISPQQLKQFQISPLKQVSPQITKQPQSSSLKTSQDVTQISVQSLSPKQSTSTQQIRTQPITTSLHTPQLEEPPVRPKKKKKTSDDSIKSNDILSTRDIEMPPEFTEAESQVNPWYPASLESVTKEEFTLGGKRAKHIKSKKLSQRLFGKLKTTGAPIPTELQYKKRGRPKKKEDNIL